MADAQRTAHGRPRAEDTITGRTELVASEEDYPPPFACRRRSPIRTHHTLTAGIGSQPQACVRRRAPPGADGAKVPLCTARSSRTDGSQAVLLWTDGRIARPLEQDGGERGLSSTATIIVRHEGVPPGAG
eukprot:scaffold1680_cov391-Prasinococcus_capsulatus_cf.AAC.2